MLLAFPLRVENTVYDERGTTKVCIKWLPCLLILDQKRARLITSQVIVSDPPDSLKRFLIQDQFHHFDPETKTQSMQKRPSSPAPKKLIFKWVIPLMESTISSC